MSYRRKHIKPRIRHLRPKKRFWQQPLFWIIFLLLLVVGIAATFLFIPALQVSNIQISGNQATVTEDIENVARVNAGKHLVMGVWSRNIFLVNTQNINKAIIESFPGIQEVVITKNMPQTISINIRERQPFAAFCQDTPSTNTGCYSIDINGVIFAPLSTVVGTTVIKNSLNNKEVFVGENVVNKTIMDVIDKVKNSLESNFQINVKEAL